MNEPTNHYGLTAARQHGRPGRETRPPGLTIDIHSHVGIAEAAAFAAPHLDFSTIPLARFATDETRALNRKQDAERTPVSADIDRRMAEMDAAGIDMQVVQPAPPQCYFTLPLDIAVPATRMVNDGMAAFVAKRPDRLLAFGTVPLQDGHEAARELERCTREHGFKGVQILTNVAGRELSDPAFAPFWAKAEALGVLVMLHPVGFTGGERFTRYSFSNVIGNPLDTTVALHHLIFDGVLERHPDLKILAVHGGGYLGSYSGRIDHAWGARSDSRGDLPRPPGDYLRKIYFDTIVFTPHQLEYLVKVFDVEKILMGTDFPYDMAEADPLGHIASVESFDASTRARIAGGNAAALLDL